MKKKSVEILKYILPVILTSLLIVGLYIVIKGMPLMHVPDTEAIAYVEITNHRLNVTSKKFVEGEDIEMSRNLANLLLHKLGKAEKNQPIIEIVYHLKNGESMVLSTDEDTVFFNGHYYHLKDDNGKLFIKIVEGVFFFKEWVEESKY